ncbi:hypothetical protein RJT34_12023 [Clitoria ternatea]|uniref:Uncharacterized protein n=1 Tax=Clitoria ternatea TaxID=43366 RepID=A0AAN9JNL9_CLITE
MKDEGEVIKKHVSRGDGQLVDPPDLDDDEVTATDPLIPLLDSQAEATSTPEVEVTPFEVVAAVIPTP